MTVNASQVALLGIEQTESPLWIRFAQSHQRILTRIVEAGTYVSQASLVILENTEPPSASPVLSLSTAFLVLAEDPPRSLLSGMSQQSLVQVNKPVVEQRLSQTQSFALALEQAPFPDELSIVGNVQQQLLLSEQPPLIHPPVVQVAALALESIESVPTDVNVLRAFHVALIADVELPKTNICSTTNLVLLNTEPATPNPELVGTVVSLAGSAVDFSSPSTVIPEYSLNSIVTLSASGITAELPQSDALVASTVAMVSNIKSFTSDTIQSPTLVPTLGLLSGSKVDANDPTNVHSMVMVGQTVVQHGSRTTHAMPDTLMSQTRLGTIGMSVGTAVSIADPATIYSTNNVSGVATLTSTTRHYPERQISNVEVAAVSKVTARSITMRHPYAMISPVTTQTVIANIACDVAMQDPHLIIPTGRVLLTALQNASKATYEWAVSSISVPSTIMLHATSGGEPDPELIEPTCQLYTCVELLAVSITSQDPDTIPPENRRNIQTSYN